MNISVVECDGLLLDLSKQRIDQPVLQSLLQLAEQQQLGVWVERLFRGEKINSSEARPALHTALRAPSECDVQAEGRRVAPEIHANLDKMATLVEQIHSRQWRGFSGKPITDVVNLGVGGSDLGPQMACHALEEFRCEGAAGLNLHFVSSIDGSQLSELLKHLNQETTLFVLSSKSFTTIDTLGQCRIPLNAGWPKRSMIDRCC